MATEPLKVEFERGDDDDFDHLISKVPSLNNEEEGVVIEKMYTVRQTAKFFQVGDQTVRNWVKNGYVRCIRIGAGPPGVSSKGKHIRIAGAEIKRLLEAKYEEEVAMNNYVDSLGAETTGD